MREKTNTQLSKAKYKHPTLIETVCEIRFPQQNKWGMTSFIKFANLAASAGFPEVVDAAEGFQLNFPVEPGNQPPSVKPVSRRIQTWNKQKNQLWQASPELFAANWRKPYQGWEKFRPHFIKGLDIYKRVAQPKEAVSLIMTYINRIEFDLDKEQPSDFITFLPPRIPFGGDIINFGCLTEHLFEDNDLLLVSAGNEKNSESDFAVILNISYTTLKPSLDTNNLKKTIEKAHTRIIQAFEKSVTDKLRERMRPL